MALLHEGQNIRDTYEVERLVGEGAFAEVYRVKHRFLGRQAMKVFKRVGMTLEETEEMLGEAIMLSRIGHPNIVRVFDANVLDTPRGFCGYFTMENVPGGSLDKFWRSRNGELLPVETSIDLVKQVCRGLSVAHRESPPVVHRDIKPQNILVGYEADGLRARISDFGLAKKVNPLTLLATAAGTLAFKPPETFSEYKADSCAGDVWAVGCTLYMLLTNRLPFKLPSDLTWDTEGLFEDAFLPASDINADVGSSLDAIISRSLQKRPSDRYATAGEMLADLDRWKPGNLPPVSRSQSLQADSSDGQERLPATSENLSDIVAIVREALAFKDAGRLSEAADAMEEAFQKTPALRDKYASQVKLWRRGISM